MSSIILKEVLYKYGTRREDEIEEKEFSSKEEMVKYVNNYHFDVMPTLEDLDYDEERYEYEMEKFASPKWELALEFEGVELKKGLIDL